MWKGSDPPPSELTRISVFDTATARVYVDKERKIEFLPYELDLLNKLGVVLRTLDAGFKTREDGLNATVNVPLPVGYTQDTAAYLDRAPRRGVGTGFLSRVGCSVRLRLWAG